MRLFLSIIIIPTILFPGCDLSGPGSSEPKKVEISFHQNWLFIPDKDDSGVDSGWFSLQNIPENTVDVSVPHTWNVMHEYQEYYGKAWYFKTFEVPRTWDDKVVKLKFSAIYRDVTIWLNGKRILERIGAGYTPFEIDIESYLEYEEQNYLAIQVSNHFSGRAIPYDRKFDWPADGGIIRNVFLVKKEIPAIDFIYVHPEFKSENKGSLYVKMGISGHDKLNINEIDVWYGVTESNQERGKNILEGNQKAKIVEDRINLRLDMENIKPWHFLDPNLYEIKLAIGYKSTLTDHMTETFGFRSIGVINDELIFNGESVRLPGLEWMPGSNPSMGMAEDSANMEKMLALLKGTNAVFTRFHWQQHDYILEWCDRNGILVQEEIPLWQAPYPAQLNDTIHEIVDRHLEEMIHAHRNHPSIISWGIGNELAAQDSIIKDLLDNMYAKIKSIDSSRLVNYVSNTFHQDPVNDGTVIGDVLMWNDYSGLWYDLGDNGFSKEMMPGFLHEIKNVIPDKPLIISEYGLCEPFFSGGDERRIELMKFHTLEYDKRSFISGNIYFSLNDYRTHMGEGGSGKFRQRVHGITDLEGNTKPSYFILKNLYSPVRKLKGEYFGENYHVTGHNHDGLPSYTLINCVVHLFDISGEKIAEQTMPEVLPGNKFNLVFKELQDSVGRIEVKTSKGFTFYSKSLK